MFWVVIFNWGAACLLWSSFIMSRVEGTGFHLTHEPREDQGLDLPQVTNQQTRRPAVPSTEVSGTSGPPAHQAAPETDRWPEPGVRAWGHSEGVLPRTRRNPPAKPEASLPPEPWAAEVPWCTFWASSSCRWVASRETDIPALRLGAGWHSVENGQGPDPRMRPKENPAPKQAVLKVSCLG